MKSPDFTPCESMPIIRIAPICNGKVYVIPHSVSPKMDIPFMEQTDIIPAKASNKLARQLMKKYASQISTSEQPRFCVKYNSPVHKDESIYLYILPLKNEKEIHFEACMPIEVIAKRGFKSLTFGPMKPVGLEKDEKFISSMDEMYGERLVTHVETMLGFSTWLKVWHQAMVEWL